MTLTWWQLSLPCPAELEDSLTWTLNALGIHRVALRHHPRAPRQRELQAWLPAADWPLAERERLHAALAPLAETFGLELAPIRWQEQDDEDWSLSWKQQWQPDPVGRRLLILPAWLEPPPDHQGRLVIRLDPGSSFGTGSHPTTRLCLEAIEALAEERGGLAGLRVADLGCGTGILGIAALLQGAAGVAAVDTDGPAVRATAANAALSGCAGHLVAEQGSLQRLVALQAGQPADLLLCNILAPVIEALCPAFHQVLAPTGVGLLSGLLVEQAPRLERELAGHGWQARLSAQESQWGLLTIRHVP